MQMTKILLFGDLIIIRAQYYVKSFETIASTFSKELKVDEKCTFSIKMVNKRVMSWILRTKPLSVKPLKSTSSPFPPPSRLLPGLMLLQRTSTYLSLSVLLCSCQIPVNQKRKGKYLSTMSLGNKQTNRSGGRVVRKPVNVNPGLNVNCSIIFQLYKNVFHPYRLVWFEIAKASSCRPNDLNRIPDQKVTNLKSRFSLSLGISLIRL